MPNCIVKYTIQKKALPCGSYFLIFYFPPNVAASGQCFSEQGEHLIAFSYLVLGIRQCYVSHILWLQRSNKVTRLKAKELDSTLERSLKFLEQKLANPLQKIKEYIFQTLQATYNPFHILFFNRKQKSWFVGRKKKEKSKQTIQIQVDLVCRLQFVDFCSRRIYEMKDIVAIIRKHSMPQNEHERNLQACDKMTTVAGQASV